MKRSNVSFNLSEFHKKKGVGLMQIESSAPYIDTNKNSIGTI
jgi:hypothetical protein